MTSLQRIGLEILGVILLCGGFVTWWSVHNHQEQKIGAQACIQATTETKQTAVDSNAEDAKAQAIVLQQKVATYEQQMGDLQRGNADLVQRLHDSTVRAGAVRHSGSAAAGDLCPIELPAGQSGPVDAIAAAETRVFNDCDQDHAVAVAVIGAYNDVRSRAIEKNAKLPR